MKKIKANQDFIDRKTKKRIKAGTVVSADKERLKRLDAAGIFYEVQPETPTKKNSRTAESSKNKGAKE